MSALIISGCGFIRSPKPVDLGESIHTLQELCDFPKPFFSKQFNAANLETSLSLSMPMSSKIGVGNVCSYDTQMEGRQVSLGDVALWQERDTATLSTVKGTPARHISVGGESVAQYVNPIPVDQDPDTARPSYTLAVSIDGWAGELGFERGDGAGAQAGAETLVRMVRALKGQPLPKI